eukprot:3172544-Amphidinium_carterae.1
MGKAYAAPVLGEVAGTAPSDQRCFRLAGNRTRSDDAIGYAGVVVGGDEHGYGPDELSAG